MKSHQFKFLGDVLETAWSPFPEFGITRKHQIKTTVVLWRKCPIIRFTFIPDLDTVRVFYFVDLTQAKEKEFTGWDPCYEFLTNHVEHYRKLTYKK